MKLNKTIALGVAGILSATVVFADSHVDRAIQGAINARQSHMQLYAFNLGILGGMAQEQIPYDADMAAMAAGNLATLSTVSQAAYWPPGSDSAAVEGSRALPVIWEDFAGIAAEGQKFGEAVAALNEVAGTDLDSMKAAFGPVGGSCGSCHRAYRQPE
ncbi:c-type cytochrome [Flavimaricola marinus]|uniref:Cytochrome c-554 n=1 Tax=Flavimaricola marinus TaxID=1819565 RepID=A0A238LD81_9RHOB|nr:cytochrome c [Flavimaricola marinus]SMY07374.1 Cytochrome c-554 [Flavimaricola marinus]